MVKNEIIVECRRVRFYSPYDEDAFFEWVKKIKSINKVHGKRDKILLSVDTDRVTNEDLYNFVALFRRYKVRMKYLEVIVSETNKEDFHYYQQGYSINVYPVGSE